MSNKCIMCGEPAFAYRMEKSGQRSYLCDTHVLLEDLKGERLMADEGDGSEGPLAQ